MKHIQSVFALGRRCNTMAFLEKYGLRCKSSPFAWMLVDLATALDVIRDDFKHYFAIQRVENCTAMYLPFWRMTPTHCYNTHYVPRPPATRQEGYVYDTDRLMVWNHHDPPRQRAMFESRIETFRHAMRLPTTLCVFVSRILRFEEVAAHREDALSLLRDKGVPLNLAYVMPVEDWHDSTATSPVRWEVDGDGTSGSRGLSGSTSWCGSVVFWAIRATPLHVLAREAKANGSHGQHTKTTHASSKEVAPLLDADVKDGRVDWAGLHADMKSVYRFGS